MEPGARTPAPGPLPGPYKDPEDARRAPAEASTPGLHQAPARRQAGQPPQTRAHGRASRGSVQRAESAAEEAERAYPAAQPAQDTLAQQHQDWEVVRHARLSVLDANLRVHLTLTRQFESEEAIQDAKTAALRAFQRNLHTEANQSTLSSGGWRHEDADRIRRVTRHAQHTMARQLQSGEAARAAIVSAICANRMARLTLSQQLEHRENIREGHTSVPVATRGAE